MCCAGHRFLDERQTRGIEIVDFLLQVKSFGKQILFNFILTFPSSLPVQSHKAVSLSVTSNSSHYPVSDQKSPMCTHSNTYTNHLWDIRYSAHVSKNFSLYKATTCFSYIPINHFTYTKANTNISIVCT